MAEVTFPPAMGFWSTLTWPYDTPWNQRLLSCAAPGVMPKPKAVSTKPCSFPSPDSLAPEAMAVTVRTEFAASSSTWFLRTAESLITLHANEAQLYRTIFLENSIKSHSSRHSWMLGTQETVSPPTNQNTSPETVCRSDLSPPVAMLLLAGSLCSQTQHGPDLNTGSL